MDKYTLMRLYLTLALTVAVAVLYITWGILHHFTLFTGKYAKRKMRNFVKKAHVPLNVAFNLLIVLFIGILVSNRAVPAVKDLPNVIHRQYDSIEGTTTTDSDRTNHTKLKENTVQVSADDGETVTLIYFGESIDDGTKVTAVYLPHSHYATVVAQEE